MLEKGTFVSVHFILPPNLEQILDRFNIGDPKLEMLQSSFADAFGSNNFSLILAFPAVRHIFPEWSGWNDWKRVNILRVHFETLWLTSVALKIVHNINSWIDEQIESEEHSLRKKRKAEDDLTPKTFIEAYLIAMQANKEYDGKYPEQ